MSQVPPQFEPRSDQMPQAGSFGEFLTFRKMIAPIFIQVIFWILVVVCVISAMVSFGIGTAGSVLSGILTLILGPLVVRIYCELIIILFRMRDLLAEIRDNTRK
jgi:hypothetical protein